MTVQSINGAVLAYECIHRHILDIRVPQNYIGNCRPLYFLHHLPRVGVLVPKTVPVPYRLKLTPRYRRSQLPEHRALQLDLSKHPHVRVNIVDTVETLLYYETVHLVVEDLLEGLGLFETECHPQGVVVGHPVVSIAIGIYGKQIEVSAHH